MVQRHFVEENKCAAAHTVCHNRQGYLTETFEINHDGVCVALMEVSGKIYERAKQPIFSSHTVPPAAEVISSSRKVNGQTVQ